MKLFKSNLPMCPTHQPCSQWARNYMKYCICSRKDWISLILGIVSVVSWGVAEVPQIITNFKQKSSEGLAIGFLMTWILGDILNVFGCYLEPATLPTQYYTAILYLVTTLALASQSIYYGHFFRHHGTSKRQGHEIESVDKKGKISHDGSKKQMVHGDIQDESAVPIKFTQSVPILAGDDNTTERVYYTSARSLSRSPTPIMNFFHSQKTPTPIRDKESVHEPLLREHLSKHSTPASETKTMLCVVFTVTIFLFTYNLKLERDSYLHSNSIKQHEGIVMQVGRKLLQVGGSFLEGHEGTKSNGIGTFLGWGMAAIYIGGRLPQIFLNIRRGNAQGLNPLMFMFALLGNSTYVASILVSSMEWSKIKPNLPWLVESSGCMLLDTFILIQFIYFRSRKRRDIGEKRGGLDL